MEVPSSPPLTPAPRGTFRLFTFRGIRVFVHWSWMLVAWFVIQAGEERYEQPLWAALEYVSLFAIVLLHEFGHALATRQVGGSADTIMLWPLGGIAYIRVAARPLAQLWGLAAGPLVNVVLWPVLYAAQWYAGRYLGGDAGQFVYMIYVVNAVLLVFNMLPVFPLDGGQILRTLLWFWLGEIRSLEVAAVLGMAGGVALGCAAWYYLGGFWTPVICGFLVYRSWTAFQAVRTWKKRQTVPV